MAKTSQRKGADGERELSAIFQAHGYGTRRGHGLYGAEPDVLGLPGIHVEAKRRERLNVSEAMAQSITDAQRFHDGTPVLIHRRSREPWLVTMRLTDWLALYDTTAGGGELHDTD